MPAVLASRDLSARWARVEVTIDLRDLVGLQEAIDVCGEPFDRALTVTHDSNASRSAVSGSSPPI